jgi:hypothetical protein
MAVRTPEASRWWYLSEEFDIVACGVRHQREFNATFIGETT